MGALTIFFKNNRMQIQSTKMSWDEDSTLGNHNTDYQLWEEGLWDSELMGDDPPFPMISSSRKRGKRNAAREIYNSQSSEELWEPSKTSRPTGSSSEAGPMSPSHIPEDHHPLHQHNKDLRTIRQARWWAMTINNPKPTWKEDLSKDVLIPQGISALVATLEVGQSGTEHLQCTVGCKSPKTMKQMSLIFPRAHLEVCIDSKRSWAYCQKTQGDNVTWDTRFNRDQKEAIKKVTEEAYRSGLRGDIQPILEEATPEYLFKNARQIAASLAIAPQLMSMQSRKRVQPLLMCLFGGTGLGKTHFVTSLMERLSDLCVFFLPVPEPGQRAWFDGLTAMTSILVMDEFRASTLSLHKLCQVVSSVPTKLECKGASVNFTCSVVVLIAPDAPWDIYSRSGEDVGQVIRRINVLLEFLPQPLHRESSASSRGVHSSFVMPLPGGAAASVSSAAALSVPDAEKWRRVRDQHQNMYNANQKGCAKIHWAEDPKRDEVQTKVFETAMDVLKEGWKTE